MENFNHLLIFLCFVGTIVVILYISNSLLRYFFEIQKERNRIEKERNDSYRKIAKFEGCNTILRFYQSEILSDFVAKHPSAKQILDDEKFNFIIEEFNLEEVLSAELTDIESPEPLISDEPVNPLAEDILAEEAWANVAINGFYLQEEKQEKRLFSGKLVELGQSQYDGKDCTVFAKLTENNKVKIIYVKLPHRH